MSYFCDYAKIENKFCLSNVHAWNAVLLDNIQVYVDGTSKGNWFINSVDDEMYDQINYTGFSEFMPQQEADIFTVLYFIGEKQLSGYLVIIVIEAFCCLVDTGALLFLLPDK